MSSLCDKNFARVVLPLQSGPSIMKSLLSICAVSFQFADHASLDQIRQVRCLPAGRLDDVVLMAEVPGILVTCLLLLHVCCMNSLPRLIEVPAMEVHRSKSDVDEIHDPIELSLRIVLLIRREILEHLSFES